MSKSTTAWLDTVAAAALFDSTPVIIAVCSNLALVEELREWLETAVPAMEPAEVRQCAAADLEPESLAAKGSGDVAVVWVVSDASDGDDAAVQARWQLWNAWRERFVSALRSHQHHHAIVFIVTELRAKSVIEAAQDLMSISRLLTVGAEPEQVDPDDPSMLKVFRTARAELEQRYQIKTDVFIKKARAHVPLELSKTDYQRWLAIIEALRDVE